MQTIRHPRKSNHCSAFTLIEVMISMMVLSGLAYLVSSTLLSYRSHRAISSENRQAMKEINELCMELMSMGSQADLDPDTWAQTLDAQLAVGGLLGDVFVVQGLSPLTGMAQVGSIQLVVDETLTDVELGTNLGMPRDLNGDGDRTDIDVSLDAVLLPVVLRLNWTGTTGVRQLIHGFYLSKGQR